MNIDRQKTTRPAQSALTPPLKWAGGKRWLVPHLESIWRKHQHRRLVEPFCGGLAVALGLAPESTLLNDLNPHLINFYRWIQNGLTLTIPMEYSETLFYQHRNRFNELIRSNMANTPEAAELFYYLNRTGFNGLCRFNRSGEFNVPFGQYKVVHYVKDFLTYRKQLAKWQFQAGWFDKIALEPDDFIYADPPYDVEFVQYAKEGFSWDDQVRLAEWLSQHPGPVVLSNQATPRIITLYEAMGFTVNFLESPRRISANGDRTPAREVLATKNL